MTVPRRSIARLVDHAGVRLALVLAFALVFNREGFRVPSGNEWVYLLYLHKAYHPSLLATDWTFAEPTAGHGFFNHAMGWLSVPLSLPAAAWVGRLVCWALAFVAARRVGRHFGLPSWAVFAGIFFWLVERQALPTTPFTDWVVGGLEAKVPAYICLLFAVDAACLRRPITAGLLAGLAFSFHSAVGLWGGAALGIALWDFKSRAAEEPRTEGTPEVSGLGPSKTACSGGTPRARLLGSDSLRFAAAAVVAGVPGLVGSWSLIAGPHAIEADDAKFLVVKALPQCLDPFAMDRWYVAVLIGLLPFTYLVGRTVQSPAGRLLVRFELALGAFFGFGFLARAAGWFGVVKLYPLRTFAVLSILFFGWQLLSLLLTSQWTPPRRRAVAVGIILLLAMPSPVVMLARTVGNRIPGFRATPQQAADASLNNDADFHAAGDWLDHNAGRDDVVIAPPWRGDGFYSIRRPLVVNWHAYRYDAVPEWRRRCESLCGDLSDLDTHDPMVGDMDLRAREHYRHLSTSDVRRLAAEYRGRWLVTTTTYEFTERGLFGVYRVYSLD